MKTKYFLILAVLMLNPYSNIYAQSHSALWGKDGELWNSKSRLPDFSFAGYKSGEEIPKYKVVANVKDYGAKGDGQSDDTEAFQKALAANKKGIIFVPKGKYIITNILEINQSQQVIKGEENFESILILPKPLNDIKENNSKTKWNNRFVSNYSWSGGFLNIIGRFDKKEITTVTGNAEKGVNEIEVKDTKELKLNQEYELLLVDDKEKSLTKYLYSNDASDISKFNGSRISFLFKILKINKDSITIDRNLRTAINTNWSPIINEFHATVQDSGIENLVFEFPITDYHGHFSEKGFNAIQLKEVTNCWVKNIKIMHSDSGIFTNSKFCTIQGITFFSKRKPSSNVTGHHGILLGGTDNLLRDFDFKTKFIHDLCVTNNGNGNVFCDGKGVNLSFDHHKRAPFGNLFTNIDVGHGGLIWKCGGGQGLGKHSASFSTFWHITSKSVINYPPEAFAPNSINLINVGKSNKAIKEENGKWFENFANEDFEPKNLYDAQLKKRLNK